jgi:hypothetical protein
VLAALSQQNDVLRRQVRSERRGRGRRETAMDGRELSALSKQVNALQERLNSAEHEQSRLHSQDQEMGLHVSQQLVKLVRKYTDKGMYAQALQTALLSAEVGSSQNHKSVGPLAALADLDIQQRRDEEAIVLLNHSWCGGRRGGRRVERLEHWGCPPRASTWREVRLALRGSWHWPLRLTTTPRRRQHGAVQAGGSLRGYACGIASSRSRFVWS